MKKIKTLYLFATLVCVAGGLFAQTPSAPVDPRNPVPDWVRVNQQKRDQMDRILNRDPARTAVSLGGYRRPPADLAPLSYEELEALRAEANGYETKYGVPRIYRKQFEDVLNLDDTGMTRIFPNKNCGEGKLVTLAELERCADVPETRSGGSTFSFRCRVDSTTGCYTKNRTDLKLKENKFVVGDGVVQGMIADLGDIDVLTVDLNHKAVHYLDDWDPKQSLTKIAEQDAKLAKGIKGRGYTFTNAAQLKLNSTYVMRSVLYRHHEKGALSVPDNGTDVRVVFKVAAIDTDGSVLIVWRELDRQFPRRKISDNF